MQSAYHTLKAVTGTLSAKLHGCRIREAFSQERDEAVIAFSGAPTHLVVSCRSDFLACYLHPPRPLQKPIRPLAFRFPSYVSRGPKRTFASRRTPSRPS